MYWLLKTEPSTYSYDDLERDKKTAWDGVSNNLALKHLRNMKAGDLALIYHTGRERAVVGLAEITSGPYPDPKKKDPRLVVVDLKPKKRFAEPVPLSEIKSDSRFGEFPLVRLPRLSVVPVTETEWKRLLKMAGEK